MSFEVLLISSRFWEDFVGHIAAVAGCILSLTWLGSLEHMRLVWIQIISLVCSDAKHMY